MDSLGFEFGGAEVLGRVGRSQPLSEAVVEPTPPVQVTQTCEIGGVAPSITTLTGKIILVF
jgi:hypothetical protein